MARPTATAGPSGTRAAIFRWHRRIRLVRRLLVTVAVVSSVVKVLRALRPPPPSPPPGRATGVTAPAVAPAVAPTATVDPPAAPAASTRWVAAGEAGGAAGAPEGYPVKVNTRSGIYHVPGGRSYERTRADRWYRSAGEAEADGFRASRSA